MAHVPHLCGVIGLTLNSLASVALIFFPPGAGGIRADGSKIVDSTFGLQVIGLRARYLYLTWGFRISMAVLALGFILTAIDLVNSP